MKRFIIRSGILLIPLFLMISCATTKTDSGEADEKQKSAEVVVDEKEKNQDSEQEQEIALDEDDEKEEKKHSKKPKKATSKKQKKAEETTEEAPAPVIPIFDDWKYMGFGGEVPKELEEAVKAAPVDFIADGFKIYDKEGLNAVILHTSGINVDQAEGKLKASVSKDSVAANVPSDISLGDYETAESGWVRLNLAYFAEKLQAEEESSENDQTLHTYFLYIAYQIYRKK